jgi:uncharacterized protein YdeI (YjbR/CyaY-like superfamily)
LIDESKTFYANSRAKWREWLEQNHQSEKSVRLIVSRKGSTTPGVGYGEAVEEALCFGWIDSRGNRKDQESFYLLFSRRNPKGYWSKSNRERAERLIKQGLMTKAGQDMIDLAKKTGTWMVLEKMQSLEIPDDLQRLFDQNRKAFENFQAFPPSSRRMILFWISGAKRPETRQRRIEETVGLAERNIQASLARQQQTDVKEPAKK